jgi:hypothetical protein
MDLKNKRLFFIVLVDGVFNKNGFTYSELETKFNELKDLMKKLNELHNKIIAL